MATETQPAKAAKLLVVEDDEMIRMLISEMLADIGHTVAAEAATVDEALEATRKTEFDLAILDADLKAGPSRRLLMRLLPATRDLCSSRAVETTACSPTGIARL